MDSQKTSKKIRTFAIYSHQASKKTHRHWHVVAKLLQKIQLANFRMSLIFKRIRSLVKQSIALLCSFLPQRVWSKLYLSSVLQVQFEGETQHVGGWEWRLFSRLLAPTIMSKWPHIRHSAASLSSTWENLHHLLFPRRAWLSMLEKCRRWSPILK